MSPDKERILPAMCSGDMEVNGRTSSAIGDLADSEVINRNGSTKINGSSKKHEEVTKKVEYIPRIKWPDLLVQIFIHAGCVYGFTLLFTHAKLYTTLWGMYGNS